MLNTEFGSMKLIAECYFSFWKQQSPNVTMFPSKLPYPPSSMGVNNVQKYLSEPCLLPSSGDDMQNIILNIIAHSFNKPTLKKKSNTVVRD